MPHSEQATRRSASRCRVITKIAHEEDFLARVRDEQLQIVAVEKDHPRVTSLWSVENARCHIGRMMYAVYRHEVRATTQRR